MRGRPFSADNAALVAKLKLLCDRVTGIAPLISMLHYTNDDLYKGYRHVVKGRVKGVVLLCMRAGHAIVKVRSFWLCDGKPAETSLNNPAAMHYGSRARRVDGFASAICR